MIPMKNAPMQPILTDEQLQEMFGADPALLAQMREIQSQAGEGSGEMEILAEGEFTDAKLEELFGDDPKMLAFMKKKRDTIDELNRQSLADAKILAMEQEAAGRALDQADVAYMRELDDAGAEVEAEEKKADILPFPKEQA